MPISLQCPNPSCRASYPVSDDLAGRVVPCEKCGVPLTVPPASGIAVALPVTIDRYQVRERLGSGGFGVVYRAFDPRLDREVALKVLRPDVLTSPQVVERFVREAKAAAKLHHPHIVPVYDAGKAGDVHYIASAFIRGKTLASAIPAGGVEPRQAAEWAAQLASALGYAHQRGVLHRDVKPANAMLDEQGHLHLMDFGLAGWTHEEADRLTKAGGMMGTPRYMSPEQTFGDPTRVGPASDLYGVGVVLYHLLTGRPPFEGHLAALVYQIVHQAPPPPSGLRTGLDPALEALCLKSLAKDPAGRFESGEAMAKALRGWAAAPAAATTEPMRLRILYGPEKGLSYSLHDGVALLVGRGAQAAVRLSDRRVSRIHCEVEREAGQVMLTDLESAGGTFVNGTRINEHALQSGDVVRIGDTRLRLDAGSAARAAGAASSTPLPSAPAPTPAPQTPERLHELTGKTLCHFEVGPLIGRGKTGLVFRAQDFKDERVVALKVFWPKGPSSSPEMRRFVRAVKTAMPLRHPNLVTTYGAGKTGWHCWMSMELIEGESLSEVIDRTGVAGQLDWRIAFRVACDLARALEFAHGNGVIHRNITPRNVLVRSEDGVAKLGDLTLAKALEGTTAEAITQPGEILGDVRYMSPERTVGGAVDGRSDLYSLGALLYALVTGRPPFDGGSAAEAIKKIRTEEPVRPTKLQMSLPGLFEGVILKLLAKQPEERCQTAAELIQELARVAKFTGVKMP